MESHSDASHTPSFLPAELQVALAPYAWMRAEESQSGSDVFRLRARLFPTLYCKRGSGRAARDVDEEYARLLWLSGRTTVPAVQHFVRRADERILVTAALPGESVYDVLRTQPGQREATVVAVARFLRQLHALRFDDCPFDASYGIRLADAQRNVAEGNVDESDFDESHSGWSAAAVLAETTAMLPLPFSRVLTHGDFSAANIILHEGRVSGCVDVGRAGVADPYQDLAIFGHSLAEFSEELKKLWWRSCGIDAPDARMVRFHLGLDELF